MAVLNGDGDCYSSCDLEEGQHAETKTISSIHEPENDTQKEQPTIKTIVQEDVSKNKNVIVDEGDEIMKKYRDLFYTKKEWKKNFSLPQRIKMYPWSMCVRQAQRTVGDGLAIDPKGKIIYGEAHYIADSREIIKISAEYRKYLQEKRNREKTEETEQEKTHTPTKSEPRKL